MPQKPEILHKEIVARSQIFRVEAVELKFSNGEQRTYERLLSRRPAVLIVPILNNEHIVLIREYGVGLDNYELTFPKGLVEENETLLQGAQRELQEEAGYAAQQLTFLRDLSMSPGYMMHKTSIILAQDLYVAPLAGDEPEIIEVVTWPIADVNGLLQREDFTEGRSIAALYLALQHINDQAR
jgi:ADP-ribose diphosphatase